MRSKLRNHIGFAVLTLTLTFLHGGFGQSNSNQYSSYPAYSTLTQAGSSLSNNAAAGSGGSVSDASNLKAVDLSTNGVGDGSVEQSQRAHQAVGYNPQPQGSHSMYYYEMYPAAKPQQRCTYTGSGMKCQYRRESAAGQGGDSYTAAAHSAPSASYGSPMMEQYGGSSYGVMDDEEGGGEGGGGLGSLGGLVGLLGLKGLKGLKALKPFALLLPLIPILLPILPLLLLPLLLPLALPLLALLLFFPVVVVNPGVRSLDGMYKSLNLTSVARMATEVIESEECIERISCEIARMSKKYNASKWLDRLTDALPKTNKYATRVVKGLEKDDSGNSATARGTNLDGNCSRFICKPKAIFAKHFVK